MTWIGSKIERNRDRALLMIGTWAYNGKTTIKEGYEPAFEGTKKYRGLPFVETDGVRVYYRK